MQDQERLTQVLEELCGIQQEQLELQREANRRQQAYANLISKFLPYLVILLLLILVKIVLGVLWQAFMMLGFALQA